MSRQDTSRNERTPCAHPNCTKAVWRDANGVYSMYCGSSHRVAMAKNMDEDDLCQVKTTSYITFCFSDAT